VALDVRADVEGRKLAVAGDEPQPVGDAARSQEAART
jgi:hypothetical protein